MSRSKRPKDQNPPTTIQSARGRTHASIVVRWQAHPATSSSSTKPRQAVPRRSARPTAEGSSGEGLVDLSHVRHSVECVRRRRVDAPRRPRPPEAVPKSSASLSRDATDAGPSAVAVAPARARRSHPATVRSPLHGCLRARRTSSSGASCGPSASGSSTRDFIRPPSHRARSLDSLPRHDARIPLSRRDIRG